MKQKIFFLFGLLVITGFTSIQISAQTGLQLYGGTSSATNKNIAITPDGSSQNGWHIGADARLNEGKMYFIIGLQHHRINLVPTIDTTSGTAAGTDKYGWTKLRVGLGYKVINFSEHIFLRGHTLASFNLVNGVNNDAGPSVFTNYNSGTAGANLGLGLDIYNFTLTAAYEIGFFNLGNMLEGSEMDFLTFSIGYKI